MGCGDRQRFAAANTRIIFGSVRFIGRNQPTADQMVCSRRTLLRQSLDA